MTRSSKTSSRVGQQRLHAGGAARTRIQLAAVILGIVFLLVGVAGFIPGVTTDIERLDVFGGVAARLLGVFGVNWLENLVHLAYGIAGLLASTSARRALVYFLVGGTLYLLIAIFGFVIDLHGDANVLGVNSAGNWLHLVLFAAMVGAGLTLRGDARPA